MMANPAILVLPADRPRMVARAAVAGAGAIVLDLEDAVAEPSKAAARASLHDALSALSGAPATVGVRINARASAHFAEDLWALGQAPERVGFVVVAKAEGREDLDAVSDELGPGVPLHALVESPVGLTRVAELAGHASCTALVVGYADLAVALGRPPLAHADPQDWIAVQDAVVVHARAAGIAAIDGPFLAIDDRAGCAAAAAWSARRGFDAKWAIHPHQLPLIQAAFRPTPEELAWAEGVVTELTNAERSGAGSARAGGAMLDEAVRKAAQRVIDRAGRTDV